MRGRPGLENGGGVRRPELAAAIVNTARLDAPWGPGCCGPAVTRPSMVTAIISTTTRARPGGARCISKRAFFAAFSIPGRPRRRSARAQRVVARERSLAYAADQDVEYLFYAGGVIRVRYSPKSITATTCAAIRFPRSPNRARISAFRRAASMKSKTAGWPALSRGQRDQRLEAFLHEYRRGRQRLAAVRDPQLRQGAADAGQAHVERRTDAAFTRPAGWRPYRGLSETVQSLQELKKFAREASA